LYLGKTTTKSIKRVFEEEECVCYHIIEPVTGNNILALAACYRVLENDGSEETYDSVILGVHAPNALKVLGAEATHDELKILGACQYVHR
jgi:cyclopropane-fatty-acyl-phospholipid synthase